MLDDIWNRFKKLGLSGSVSIRNSAEIGNFFTTKSDTSTDVSEIVKCVFDIDPDYTVVAIVTNPPSTSSFDSISLCDEISIHEQLDKCIAEGLAHRKRFVIKESGFEVRFGYRIEDILA